MHELSEIGVFVDCQCEMSALPGAQHIRRPRGGAARHQQCLPDACRRSRAQDGANIARVLDAIEQNGVLVEVDRNCRLRHGRYRQQAARRIDQSEITQQAVGEEQNLPPFDESGYFAG